MRYTVLFCSKTGAKRVNPGQARSGSHARRPTPRRLSVFCSTTLGIQISNGHAEEYGTLGVVRHSNSKNGGTPLLCWADAVHSDVFGHGLRRTTRSPQFKI